MVKNCDVGEKEDFLLKKAQKSKILLTFPPLLYISLFPLWYLLHFHSFINEIHTKCFSDKNGKFQLNERKHIG